MRIKAPKIRKYLNESMYLSDGPCDSFQDI